MFGRSQLSVTLCISTFITLLFSATGAQAQIIDFTKAIRVDTGIYAGNYGYENAALYAVQLSKNAELIVGVSGYQTENTYSCRTNFHFVIYDSFKRELKRSYGYISWYHENKLYTDDLTAKATAKGLYYVYVTPKISGQSFNSCEPVSSQIQHSITISIETKGNTPTGPGAPVADWQRQCIKAQKYFCQASRYKRNWTKVQTSRCVSKRKKKYCGL